MKYPVLILNQNYQPFDIWSWQKTMSKLLGSHSILPVYTSEGDIVKYDRKIRDGQGNMYDLPAVVVLKKYIGIHHGLASYSKINVYARDYFQCQYCGHHTTPTDRSIDHIIPRSQFNPKKYKFKLSSFENVVTCCRSCNLKKRNRTPQQANMFLIRKPIKPLRSQVYQNKLSIITPHPEQWNPYLHHEQKTVQ